MASRKPTYGSSARDKFDRMDGLVNIGESRAMITLMQSISYALQKEGFDYEDTIKFITFTAEQNIEDASEF
jgi:hypothetical protein